MVPTRECSYIRASKAPMSFRKGGFIIPHAHPLICDIFHLMNTHESLF